MRGISYRVLLVFVVLVSGCTGKTGPQGLQGPQSAQGPQGTQGAQGPQGPAGPAYPEHRVFEITSSPVYYSLELARSSEVAPKLVRGNYDVEFEIRERELRITPIDTGELYEEKSTAVLTQATRLPTRVNMGSLSEGQEQVFFLKNEYSRFAKFRVDFLEAGDFLTKPNVFVEYFYYRDTNPNFALHKLVVP